MRYYPRIFPERLKKTTKHISHNNQCNGRDSKRATAKYKPKALLLDKRVQCLIKHHEVKTYQGVYLQIHLSWVWNHIDVSGQLHAPATLSSRERASRKNWRGPKAAMESMEKHFLLLLGIEPWFLCHPAHSLTAILDPAKLQWNPVKFVRSEVLTAVYMKSECSLVGGYGVESDGSLPTCRRKTLPPHSWPKSKPSHVRKPKVLFNSFVFMK
jgi:hypothetical protein